MDMDEKETRWDPGGDAGCQENWFWNKLVKLNTLCKQITEQITIQYKGIYCHINVVWNTQQKKYIHDKEATEEKDEESLSGILSTIINFFIWHLKY